MPARNFKYYRDIPAGVMPDGWRYRLTIIPAHTDPYDGSETYVELPEKFITGIPEIDEKSDIVPIGFNDAAMASCKVNLASVEGTPLYHYLTDDGLVIDYALTVNTIWIISSDRGNAGASVDDFTPLFVGVQRDYVGNKIVGDELSVELVDIGKACFEAIPIWEAGTPPYMPSPDRSYYTLEDKVRSRISTMGGLFGIYTPIYRDRAFDLLYKDADGNVYAVMRHNRDGSHQYAFVRWKDIIAAWKDTVSALLRLLLRTIEASVVMQHDESRFAGTGCVTDNIVHYEQGFTDDGAEGNSLNPDALYLLAWVRENKNTETWVGQKIFGGALWEDNVVPKEYKTLWDWYRDLTENSIARGAFSYGQLDNHITLFINTATVYDSTHESSPGFNLANYTLVGEPEYLRGGDAGRISRAVGNIADPIGRSETEFPRPVASSPQSLKHWDSRFALHTNPVHPDDADHYWIKTPSSRHKQDRNLNTDFTPSGLGENIIAGTSAANLQCFYYFAVPEFYTGSEPSIAMRVHHKVTFNALGMTGTYELPEGTNLQLPTWDSLGFPDVPFEQPGAFYSDTMLKAWRATIIEIGRRGWPAYIAYVAASLIGRPEQRSTKVKVKRSELHFANQGMLQVVRFNPADLKTLNTGTKPNALITAFKQDIGAGVDEITLFNFWEGI